MSDPYRSPPRLATAVLIYLAGVLAGIIGAGVVWHLSGCCCN